MVRKFTTAVELPGDPASGLQAATKDYVDTGLSAKVPTSRSVIAGTGLTGGGSLAADRTLSADFGTAAGKIAQGNDSRITGAEQTSNKGVAGGYAALDGNTLIPRAYNYLATTTLDGTIKMTGALGGSGSSPTIPSLAGGATGTFLSKNSGTDYDTAWKTPTQLTASLDLATKSLKGLMSSSDKLRMDQFYDAEADFGFVGDLWTTLGTTAVTGTAMTDSTNPFTADDVGKRVVVPKAGAGSSPNQAALITTIAAYVNSGQVTLTTGATNNVSTASVHYGTDNSAAEALMVSTINNLVWSGARVQFGRGATNRYGVQTCWVFNKACQIEGLGGGHTADSGTWQTIGGTCLVWWGSSSDGGTPFQAMINFIPTGAQNLKRVALRHIWLDCNNNGQNQALYGLKLVSCAGHMLEDFYVMDALAQSVWLDVGSTPTEAKDTTRFSHRNLCYRQLDHTPGATTTPTTTSSALTWSTSGQSMSIAAANNLRTSGYVWVESNLGYPILVYYTGGGGTTTLTGCRVSTEDTVNAPASYANAFVVEASPGNAGAYKLNGVVGADTCCGIIEVAQISYGTTWGPAAIEFMNSDSIIIRNVFMNGGSNTTDSNGNRQRRPGIRFNGSNTNIALVSRNNIVYDTDPGGNAGGGISSMGVNNAGTALTYPAGPNKAYGYNLGNGASLPTVEGAAQFVWTGNGCLVPSEHGRVSTSTLTCNSSSSIIIAQILLPPQWAQIGLTVRCRFTLTKTAAGSATRVTGVKLGTAGTTSDTTVNSVSRTPTAAADAGVEEIVFTVVGPLGASCTSVMTSVLNKGTASAGLSNSAGLVSMGAGTPVTFNSGGGQTWLSFFMTTGLSEVITILPPVLVEVLKGASP